MKIDFTEKRKEQRRAQQAPLNEYIRSRINTRKCVDRRAPQQIAIDNAKVSKWMNTYSTIRAGTSI